MLDCQLDTFSPSSIAELLKVFRTLESKSDPLPAALLKEQFDMLLPTLCMIVKLTLESGHLPASLKMPSYHHYSRNLGNYRPISNLKVISKYIEKVVASRHQDYLKSNELNESLQSAYKRFHSCETALVRMQIDILRVIDSCHCVIILLLDPSTASGTVDHDIFLRRLHSSNFFIYYWLYTIYPNQWQKKKKKSQPRVVKCGCLKALFSLLPILYLLYTAPLADAVRHHKMQFPFYADDTQLYSLFQPTTNCN